MVKRASLTSIVCKIIGLMVAVVALVLINPTQAYARSYSMPQVDIDAVVAQDGSVTVTEDRYFDFSGEFNGVYWLLPKGSYKGVTIVPEVQYAGVVENGVFIPFDQSDSNNNRTYEFSDQSSNVQLKIFNHAEDEVVQARIQYRLPDLVVRYNDVAELYWKYVADRWEEESEDVTLRLHLPVPQGEAVIPEDTVRAWGHGPLDGSVSFENDDIVFYSPGIGTSEFAEARVTFPANWLSEADVRYDKDTLDEILSEETAWANEANELREKARTQLMGLVAAGGGVTLLTLVTTLHSKRRYNTIFKAQFDDTYYRDVPSNDHPAVLAALMNDGSATDNGFTATLMGLTDKHAISLDKVKLKKTGFLGHDTIQDDFRVNIKPETTDVELNYADPLQRQAATIDKKALEFLSYVALRSHPAQEDQTAIPPVYFSQFEDVARLYPESFSNNYNKWVNEVESTYVERFKPQGNAPRTGVGLLIALFVISILAGIVFFGFAVIVDAPIIVTIVGALLIIAAGVFALVTGVGYRQINQEGLEIKAKLEALKRWLKDFTRLEEAIPTDVVLWNKLLVMAVVLGVSKEVIEQLKVSMPEILEDPYMRSVYSWYYVSDTGASPASSLSKSVSTAHNVSTAVLAESSSSSGGGGGGGFSGGGGGGFGGGGGGGAF